jgi:EmrB/QacA subfamily drug resistance transporter
MNRLQSTGSYRWLMLGIIMSGAFMAILDMSIVNVALPHMMSSFGVNRDEIEWVSTAFMLAAAVTMPLVNWLASRVGYKALYLGSLALFTAGSAACALAWSYDSLIAARVFQAVGSGSIQPIGLAVITDLFEPHERGRALGIWGVGIMVGPALGPTLGGYLTDWSSWRAIFAVNIPVGIVTILAGLAIMRTEPDSERHHVPLDGWGFVFLSMALIAGLIALSNGQEKGWTSDYILVCTAVTLVGLAFFIAIETSVSHPLLDLKLFFIRNFTISILLTIFRAIGLFGGLFLLPIFLENLVGYTTIQAGLWMMPGAVVVGIMMPIAGRLTDKYSCRWLVTMGTTATGISLILYGNLDPLSGYTAIIGPQVVRGFGLAFMMTPLITAALNAVPKETVTMVSSFLSISQRVGGSFGIALLNTFVTNAAHTHAVRLGGLLPAQSKQFHRLALKSSSLVFHLTHGLLPTGRLKALTASTQAILHHAQVLGFQNGFVFAGLFLFAGIPLALFLKPYSHRQAEEHAS